MSWLRSSESFFFSKYLLCVQIAEEGRKILRDVTDQEEQRIVNVSSVTDVSADMQISDGEGDISYDD